MRSSYTFIRTSVSTAILQTEEGIDKPLSMLETASTSPGRSFNSPALTSGEAGSLLGDLVVPADNPVVAFKESQCHSYEAAVDQATPRCLVYSFT